MDHSPIHFTHRLPFAESWRWFFLFVFILPFGFGAHASREISQPYQGVLWVVQTESSPRPLRIHLALFELATPGLRFKLTPRKGPMDTLRQTTLGFLREQSAQLAINSHFYVPYNTSQLEANLVGLAVSDGVLYSPFEGQPVGPGFPDQSYALVPFAPALNLDAANHPSIVHPAPNSKDGRIILERAQLWTALSGSAQIVTDGFKTIPRYSGSPNGLKPMNGYSDATSWYDSPRARTAIGFTRDGKQLLWFTVDQSANSAGMTVGEVADFLIREWSIYQALNLDGGPSTAVAMQDPLTGERRLMNEPYAGTEGPALGSNLCVFAPENPDPDRLLKIESTRDHVVLSWPDKTRRWTLQETSAALQNQWAPVSGTRQSRDGRIEVRLTLTSETTFYRLLDLSTPGSPPQTERR
jgi:hypothetical protein